MATKENLLDYEQILKLSQEWMASEEFNQQYIQTNHPYPPLLNPKMLEDENSPISYKNIPADFAWEMNLPLPKGYLFLFLMMSHSGHSSMVMYLKKCGVSIMQDHLFGEGWMKKHYEFNYKELLNKKTCVINFTSYGTAEDEWFIDLNKYIYLISPQTRVLCLVRDPIPRLKVSLNNYLGKDYWGKEKLQYFFDENDDLKGLENRLSYVFNIKSPYKNRVEYIINHGNLFRYSEIYEKLQNLGFQQFDFLDIQKIIQPEDIFNLMNNLAKEYHFNPPKSVDDFEIPEHRVYSGFLPLRYDVKGAEFLFTQFLDKKGNVEITSTLKLDLSWFSALGKEMFIYTRPTDLPIIQENFDYVQFKIKKFLNKLREVIELERKERLTSETELLNFFKTHLRHRKLLENVLKKEIEMVKEHRPDIVQTWHYYLEFEKICQELNAFKK